jgi:hypothetical protein
MEKVAVLPVPDWAWRRSERSLVHYEGEAHLSDDVATLDDGNDGSLLDGGRSLKVWLEVSRAFQAGFRTHCKSRCPSAGPL